MFYDIVQVIPNEDYTVYVYFEDGKIVCYDAKTLLKRKFLNHWKILNFYECMHNFEWDIGMGCYWNQRLH